MKFSCRAGLLALVAPIIACGTLLRRSRSATNEAEQAPAAVAAPRSKVAATKLGRLLADVDKSVRSAGEDAELIFAQLYRYDQQLEASLGREVNLLNTTRSQLAALQARYRSTATRSAAELNNLDAVVGRSKGLEDHFQVGALRAGSRFDGLLASVHQLIAILRGAEASRSGRVPRRSQKAIRVLLTSYPELKQRFADVFDAWVATPQQKGHAVPQAPALLHRTAAALKELATSLRRRSAKALLQFESRGRRLADEEARAASRSDAARDAQAEGERKVEELAFSAAFTEAVLRSDRDFREKLQEHVRVKAGLVEAIRIARKSQLTTLYDLVDLVEGRYSTPEDNVGAGATAFPTPVSAQDSSSDGDANAGGYDAEGDADIPASFLQLQGGSATVVGSNDALSSGLQSEIETALRNKRDTHGILLRVQSILDHAAPIDAGSVQEVLTKMGSALRAVDTEDASGEDARRRCAAQQLRATQEEQRLRSSLQRMGSSRNHTQAAIKAASRNLESIAAKVMVLNKTSKAFGQLVARAEKTLGGQRRDRATIMAAVRRAEGVAPRAVAPSSTHAAGALLGQLLAQLEAQDEKEQAYGEAQAALRADFEAYTGHYRGLLDERRSHYADALSALELYDSELAGDAAARAGALDDDSELLDEGRKLCDSLLAFYKRHGERRLEVSRALRAVLPKLPDALNQEATADDAMAEGDEAAEEEEEAA